MALRNCGKPSHGFFRPPHPSTIRSPLARSTLQSCLYVRRPLALGPVLGLPYTLVRTASARPWPGHHRHSNRTHHSSPSAQTLDPQPLNPKVGLGPYLGPEWPYVSGAQPKIEVGLTQSHTASQPHRCPRRWRCPSPPTSPKSRPHPRHTLPAGVLSSPCPGRGHRRW